MSQHDPSVSSTTPVMPILSDLFASYSNAQGFWINERSVPATKNEEGAVSHPLSSSLLQVDIARDLRSAQYSRNKAKDEAKSARAKKLKRQSRPRREHPTQRSKSAKRSGRRQPIARDFSADSETAYEQDLSDSLFSERREAVLVPIGASGDRPISLISPELQPPTEKTPKGYTPPDAYTTATLPESILDIPAFDVTREFRSYERYRHQAKKNARFTQSRQKKGTRVKPIRSRSSKSVKTKNLRSTVTLTIVDEETTSEDEIQTPIEVSLSVVLPDAELPDVRAPPAIDMKSLITTAKVKYTKEPSFEYVKRVRPVVVLDDIHDTHQEDDNETWEYVWNDDLVG